MRLPEIRFKHTVCSGLLCLATAVANAQGRVDVSDLPDEPGPSTYPAKGEAVRRTAPAAPTAPQGTVGRRAAQKYMGQRGRDDSAPPIDDAPPRHTAGKDAHYLALHIGGFISDNEYKWGPKDADANVGKLSIGLTYRFGEWQNSMDFNMRIDYQTYNVGDGANKLSFLPVILFPEASSRFPLYFGVGAGLGVFTKQAPGESPISFDYQLLVGARFFNIADTNAGVFLEAGLKNHFLIFSDGQFNGAFMALGGVFTF